MKCARPRDSRGCIAHRRIDTSLNSKEATMRRLVLCGMVVSAPLLAGCGAENIQGPSFASRDALLADAGAHAAPVYTYRSIAYPGATATTAWGINAGGDVVGDYVDPAGVRHGFLVRNGEFTTIDFPNALTSARGIGPGGNIVGIYRGASEPAVNARSEERRVGKECRAAGGGE